MQTESEILDEIAVSPWNNEGNAAGTTERRVRIADCTLRDGEQQAGVVFTRDDKVAIARSLGTLGVDDIEVGTPAVSSEDREAIEEIVSLRLGCQTSALARARQGDIDEVRDCGVDAVRISLPISSRQRAAKLHVGDDEYLDLALEVCGYAKEIGLGVIFSPYDTTRCDLALLRRLLEAFARTACVDRVRLVDTAGAATPAAVSHLVHVMQEASNGIPIEVHCHNDFGLATANTIAGVLAGAEYVSVTVNGLGERSGNAALEEVAMALHVLYGVPMQIDRTMLAGLSADVVRRSGVPLQQHKAIVGSGAFAHESGTVVAGVLKDPFTAEAYRPETVGQTRRIVVGKKSGAKAIEWKLEQLGLAVKPEAVHDVLAATKARAIVERRALTDDEFRAIAESVAGPR